jgi:hypothetical protein
MSFVYILTNEAMPGYVKIGITERDIAKRITELDSTGVPLPFRCYYAAEVSDHKKIEKALHVAFGDRRVRSSREFFTVDPYRVKAILEAIAIREVTPELQIFESKEDAQAVELAIRRAPRFKFSQVDIPIGAILQFTQDNAIESVVQSDTEILFEGKLTSLSAAALIATHRLGYKTPAAAGPWYWLYNNQTLDALRRERELAESN